MSIPKILFIVDIQNWAFDYRAKTWKKLLENQFNIDIIYLKEYNKRNPISLKNLKYNGYVFFYYKAPTSKIFINQDILYNKTAICINNEKWKLEGSEYTYNKYLKNFKLVIGCNDCIISEFSKYFIPISKVTQCVDNSIFYPLKKPTNKKIKIGWCGNQNTKEKNIDCLISACNDIPEAELNIQTNLNQEELNRWYNSLDMVVCVSEFEGGPNLLLESGACKVPIITTPCGLSNELIIHEETGLIVPHHRLDILIKAIQDLSKNKNLRDNMINKMYNKIINNWTYQKKLPEIINALTQLVN